MIKIFFGRILHFFAFFLPMGNCIRPLLHKIRGVKIGKNVWISKFVYIDEIHPEAISIGDNSTIGFRTTIYAHTYFGRRKLQINDKVVIGENVFIGPHCLILPNVVIGDNAVIKGGAVISHNIPPNTMWGPPQTEMFAKVTVPLSPGNSYSEFVLGLRPLRKNNLKEPHLKLNRKI